MITSHYNLGLYFEEVVRTYPDNIALRYGPSENITYAELNSLANRWANYLLAQGVNKNDVVALINTKNTYGFACMLACLKIGAIYTNVDETNPSQRMKKMFSTCQPKLVLCDHEPSQVIQNLCDALKLEITPIYEVVLNYPEKNLAVTAEITGSNPAYIMFTSGSTGVPKGAVISHANVINFIHWSTQYYSITPNDRLTNVNPIYFDNSVFDFYSALFSGASLIPVSRELMHYPEKMLEFLDKRGATIWFSVPSLLIYLTTLKALSKDKLQSLKVISFGGEGYPKSMLQILYQLYPGKRFVNVYGPTECTCICSAYDITDADFINLEELPPLGKLTNNFSYLILKDNAPVENGEVGELCLLGPSVGKGYYNDVPRTQKSFTLNPLNHKFHEIMYRTGDLVKESAQGLLFIGRKDNQIKHLGYRIELEEIESALNQLSYVNHSAVIYHRVNDKLGHIAAFIASDSIKPDHEIRLALKSHLPEYMLPNDIEVMEQLPKNQNGKVDKLVLQEKMRQKYPR